MSTIFKIVFFCCNSTEETKEEVEPVDKNAEYKIIDKNTQDAKDSAIPQGKEKISHKSYSEDNPARRIESDSSESCSISSGAIP